VERFGANRRMVAASAAVGRESDTIHAMTEVDISEPRRRIRAHRERTGEGLSLTAYVVACLSRALAEQPELNAFRRGRKLVVLDDVTVNTLVEREIDGERVPEPCPIRAAQRKSYREIHDEIRAAQRHTSGRMGTLSDSPWYLWLLPEWGMRWFMRLAGRSTRMAKRYGVASVTAIGMFGSGASWAVPLTSGTVTVTVGSIVRRAVVGDDGSVRDPEHLCLTVSFNHDIVDGAPAARFMKRFGEILSSGELVEEA
jgi:pyruvate/2-oxoglutarate dehydrogenase complex dihydrolipoamide acyltransferase (E2) component